MIVEAACLDTYYTASA